MGNLLVVGGGPIGLNLATKVAEEKWSVDLIEEHSHIGKPVHCSGCNELNLDVSSVNINLIYGAKIFSPDGQMIEIERKKPVANLVNREKFDLMFYQKAKNAGVNVHLNSKLMNIRGKSVFFQKNNHGEIKKADYVVGADGVQSKTRELLGQNVSNESFIHAYQEQVIGNFEDTRKVEIHFGDFAKGYFAWVIPKSSTEAEIGLGVKLGNQNPANAYKKFLEEKKIEIKTVSKESALIPCALPLKNIVKNNTLLVGDSAFQTKATTGGGLMLGLQASNIASESVLNAIKYKKSLDSYSKNLKQLNKEFQMHYKIYKYFESLSNQQINKLFTKAKRAGVQEFLQDFGDMDKPSKFVGKILTKPRLWGLIPSALRVLF